MEKAYKLTTTLYTQTGAIALPTEAVNRLAEAIKATLDAWDDAQDTLAVFDDDSYIIHEAQMEAIYDLVDALGFVSGPDEEGLHWRIEPKTFPNQLDFDEVE